LKSEDVDQSLPSVERSGLWIFPNPVGLYLFSESDTNEESTPVLDPDPKKLLHKK
jgi:hypothetical protein